jgi:hypothetical protein
MGRRKRPASQTQTPENGQPDEALKYRGLLTIRFNPEMSEAAAPTGRHGWHRTFGDTTVQPCLTMKALYRITLWQRVPAKLPVQGGIHPKPLKGLE